MSLKQMIKFKYFDRFIQNIKMTWITFLILLFIKGDIFCVLIANKCVLGDKSEPNILNQLILFRAPFQKAHITDHRIITLKYCTVKCSMVNINFTFQHTSNIYSYPIYYILGQIRTTECINCNRVYKLLRVVMDLTRIKQPGQHYFI